MPAPNTIHQLVDQFSHNLREYKNPLYSEAQVRVEFINPFWEALGWDVHNRAGNAFAYREVVHEAQVKMGNTTKAADYAFRIGKENIFFLEAKKPSIDLKANPEPAFQLRRYGYSARLPISMLSDFEELSIYDTRLKPAFSDKSHVGRMLYYTFAEYVDKWDEIVATFSKEAVLRGGLQKFVEDNQTRRPAKELDKDFLASLDEWRILLARNIALRNPDLSERELNYAVQMTIDRLIFLRMAEDRGLEPAEKLRPLLNGTNAYARLIQIYHDADDRYNSGLFHFSPRDGAGYDALTPGLAVDDKTLQDIIRELYYPCPYAFNYFPVEVLGNAYEQFLGKRITLTAGHRAKIEEKPEVRKAGGVYYTPQYIVDYIVAHTVGELVRDKTPQQVSRLRVLDPACGSGSFLLGAYQFLLDWHLQVYLAEYDATRVLPVSPTATGGKARKSDPQAIFQDVGGWQLTTAEKKRILLSNIYGVDIDANAVEVTKLSLLLKVLENESSASIGSTLTFLHERALPNLAGNIKCGNSLIGPDYYANQQSALFDEAEMLRVNVFDWQKEFAEVFAAGGFDAVIGNPPYVRQETLGDFKEYFQAHYKVYHGMADLYTYFIEKGISLLRPDGQFSYIVANKWMRANYGQPLRHWLKEQHIEELIDFGDLQVFRGATTYPCIIKVIRKKAADTFSAVQVDTLEFSNLTEYIATKKYSVDQTRLDDTGWSLSSASQQDLLDKLKSIGVPLGKYVNGKIYYGIKTGLNEAFVISKEKRDELIASDSKSGELIRPFLAGRDIKRYEWLQPKNYAILMPRGWTAKCLNNKKNPWNWLKENYPAIAGHLEPFKEKAEKRYDKGEFWWELRSCEYYDEFEKPKMLLPDISQKGNFAFDSIGGFYCANTCYMLCNAEMYVLGILNSKLFTFFYTKLTTVFRGGYLRFFTQYLETVPIRIINFEDNAEKSQHDHLVTLVQRMLDLHKSQAAARDPRTREQLQRQIEATDAQIDQLVYELYGLTEEERRIVEQQ